MGATVTCGVLAGAFAHSTGQTFYVLFENTYETNCYPHTHRGVASISVHSKRHCVTSFVAHPCAKVDVSKVHMVTSHQRHTSIAG